MKRFMAILVFVHFLSSGLHGQNEGKDSVDHYQELENRYQFLKDSLTKTYFFTPAVSSVMMEQNQVEVIFYGLLSSSNEYRDNERRLGQSFQKTSIFNIGLQITYGVSKNANWNFGFDINYKATRIDADRNSTMFRVFNSEVTGNSKFASAINSFGPRVRLKPFQQNSNFILQSGVLFPTSYEKEKELVLGKKQINFLQQFLYNQPLGDRFFFFSQLGLQYGFKNKNALPGFLSNVTAYINYLIPRRIVVFGFLNYAPYFVKNEKWKYTLSATQAGGGVQYQFSKKILINVYYSNTIGGKNTPDFDNYTISLRFFSN